MRAMARSAPKSASAAIHRKVVEEVHRLSAQAPAFHVAKLAKQVRKDPRTVMHHLEMLETAGDVLFLDAERRVVSTQDGLQRALRDAALEGWQNLSKASLAEIWDNEQDDVFNRL